ncbi:hypothetical protein BpHYR1_011560 [Brachionus plicatilis]|uniref:Uncharacterized protein n=1 Tax=Brachionus plicatilis TaxID=10195 RepID=A0A3M7SR46_BRAPC|nr:hypothetical protein BpHYR1_011560 [Brachionus plicatilis]
MLVETLGSDLNSESNFEVLNRKSRVIFHPKFFIPRIQNGGGSAGIWGCIENELIITLLNPKIHICKNSAKIGNELHNPIKSAISKCTLQSAHLRNNDILTELFILSNTFQLLFN